MLLSSGYSTMLHITVITSLGAGPFHLDLDVEVCMNNQDENNFLIFLSQSDGYALRYAVQEASGVLPRNQKLTFQVTFAWC